MAEPLKLMFQPLKIVPHPNDRVKYVVGPLFFEVEDGSLAMILAGESILLTRPKALTRGR